MLKDRWGPATGPHTSVHSGAQVKVYTLYIDDDRYSVPSLDAVTSAGDDRACDAARARLATSDHYLGVEIWEDDRLVCKLQR